MTGPDPINIFDGHNDLAYQLWRRRDTEAQLLDATEDSPHITAGKAKTGAWPGCLRCLSRQGEDLGHNRS